MHTYHAVGLVAKSFSLFGVGWSMQLLSQEKNQNSPDRRGVAHALIKHTVHVSTITLLRGFALCTQHITERVYVVSYEGFEPACCNRALGGVLGPGKTRRERVSGSCTPAQSGFRFTGSKRAASPLGEYSRNLLFWKETNGT